jgi:outer membrane protein assembly factor BamB
MNRKRIAACLTIVFVWAANAWTADPAKAAPGSWPGWRGPERTGVSTETGLLKQWPPDGPPLLWKVTGLGGGYSTPSVAGGRLFVMGSQGNEEFLMALDIKDGHKLWSVKVGLVGENTGPNYPGPRATPTVDGGALYTLGSDGDLICADAATGKILWHKHLVKDFQGKRGTWAYAESPLIDGDVLVCTPGGDTATMAALDKRTGEVRWKMVRPDYNGAAYASAIVAEAGNVRQYIQLIGPGLMGVSARDGRLLWFYKKHIGGVHAAAAVFHDGCVFSSAPGVEGAGGDALLRLSAEGQEVKTKEVYLVRNILSLQGGVVRVGDYLYGASGSTLVCMEFKSGTRKWRERCVSRGSLMAADGHLYVRGDQGEMALVETTPDGYKEKGRFRQPVRSRFPTFCHPVVAGGRLYLRDDDVLFCFDVQEK